MARWISSKLKVAENLLQQIDQQAAESLGKGESGKEAEEDRLRFDSGVRSPGGTVSLKDQLRKKGKEDLDLLRKNGRSNYSSDNGRLSVGGDGERGKGAEDLRKGSVAKDGDWTELLSTTPKKLSRSGSSGSSPSNGKAGSGGGRGVRRDQGKTESLGSNKKSEGRSVGLDLGSGGVEVGVVGDGRGINGKEESMPRSSNVGSDAKVTEGWEFGLKEETIVDGDEERVAEHGKELVVDALGEESQSNSKKTVASIVSRSMVLNLQVLDEPLKDADGVVSSGRNEANARDGRTNRSVGSEDQHNAAIKRLGSDDLKRGSSLIDDEESDSESESASAESDSEMEREREEKRKRRQEFLAAKAAARAAEAIKERENLVARLEGEKQSLEKILEERAKQAALEYWPEVLTAQMCIGQLLCDMAFVANHEAGSLYLIFWNQASELQSMMIEMMEAVDLEKRKHNNTRMEALARLAVLETANADLAKALASAQWNLENEVNQVAELRKQVELRELAHEEMRRKIASTQQAATSVSNSVGSQGAKLEHEMLLAECSFIADKIKRLKDKERKLKEIIESTQKEMHNQTEVEVEIKRRLSQMTDHLIQKQSQVEALSSEKAMLLFRVEAVSTLLDENKSQMTTAEFSGTSPDDDLETGAYEFYRSKEKPILEGRLQSGKRHLNSLVWQLDAIFATCVVVLRRKPEVKLFSLVYLLCLHVWVLYILLSHSSSSGEAKSGAVFSLENINTTSGV
ncbi:Golgin putative 2-like protein [Drosera capensis]